MNENGNPTNGGDLRSLGTETPPNLPPQPPNTDFEGASVVEQAPAADVAERLAALPQAVRRSFEAPAPTRTPGDVVSQESAAVAEPVGGVRENSDWVDDVNSDLTRAFAQAMRLAEDDRQKNPGVSLEEHLVTRMNNLRREIQGLDILLRNAGGREEALARERDEQLKKLVDAVETTVNSLGEAEAIISTSRAALGRYLEQLLRLVKTSQYSSSVASLESSDSNKQEQEGEGLAAVAVAGEGEAAEEEGGGVRVVETHTVGDWFA